MYSVHIVQYYNITLIAVIMNWKAEFKVVLVIGVLPWKGQCLCTAPPLKGNANIHNDNVSRMHHWLYICLDILPTSFVDKHGCVTF